MKKENKKNILVLFVYLLFFAVVLLPGIKGMGQYWDWTFPYYSDHLGNMFLRDMNAWSDINLGKLMSYNSSYYFYFIIYLISFLKLPTEIVLYLIVVILLALISYFSYLIAKRYTSGFLCYLLPLLVVFNTALLYKIVAGHLAYLASFVLFVYLFFFLLEKFRGKLRDYFIVAVIMAFSGVQIQFFAINILVLIVYFIFNKKYTRFKYLLLLSIVTILINLPWLSNFIVGVNSVSGSAEYATMNQFPGLSVANPIWVFTFLFSKATIIKYFYPKLVYLFFSAIYLFVFYFYWKRKKKIAEKDKKFVTTLFLIFLVLSTGFFWYLNYYPINLFFPMFREIGHFAPVVVFFLVLFIATYLSGKKWSKFIYYTLGTYIVAFIGINIWGYINYLPTNDYSLARESFQEFKDFQQNKSDSGRVLFYPFLGQFGFATNDYKYSNDYLMNNSGWDGFSMYSNNYIENYSTFNTYKDSIEYEFIHNYDLKEYINRGVKYIFDFSDIYESNFERYVEPEVYDNDLSLIKNNPEFFEKIIENNPGKVKRIDDKILEIVDYKPRIFGDGVTFRKINSTKYKIYIKNIESVQDLEFISSYHKDWKLYLKQNPSSSWCSEIVDEQLGTTECKNKEDNIVWSDINKINDRTIFDSSHKESEEFGHTWTIDPEFIKANFDESYYKINDDDSIDIELELYFRPQSYYLISLLLSILTIISTAGYLIFYKLRFRKV